MANWEEIRREWETSKITLAALADKHNVKLGTLKSRKSREKWSRNATGKKDATKSQKVATHYKEMQPAKKKKATSNAQKNRSGNPNPKNQFTKRNSAARKHGFFSKYIPAETLEIMGMLDKEDPADLIWDQIQIQYAAIIRAQQVMYVENKDEIIKVLKKKKDGMDIQEREWEFQFAWDRQASFLNAQSRAIAELRSSIKQFLEMAHDEDERRLKLELMQANIDKSKAEAEKLSREQGEEIEEIVIVDEWGDGND
ncbi:phage terminase small subunit [Virgibacillus sp. YIM 98842]|uniref:phage terminase small subunit n=1 Tax=Virgibacillus sp. YIM 98842 TaxID=2663533 RepID=UPI0013D9A1A3|nr:phage terminase small subunit [Virgibacillus sp. YIM 98842]